MKLIATVLAMCIVSPAITNADDSDDTLKFYLSKSDLIVAGKLANTPLGVTNEIGVIEYVCEYVVSDVIKGDKSLSGKTIKLTVTRFEMDAKDRTTLLAKNAESIIFLKQQKAGSIPKWKTTDFWFGIQPQSSWMVRSLKRLSK